MTTIVDSLHLTASPGAIYTSSATLEQGALARGVFGGQVIAQALTAATKELPRGKGFKLSSMHCYFLAAAASNISLRFEVILLRQGRSFVNYSVSASQNGTKVFACMCAFKLDEPGGSSFALPCPPVPSPKECTSRADVIRGLIAAHKEWSPRLVANAEAVIKETEEGPIEVLDCPLPNDPVESRAYWLRGRGLKPGQLAPDVQKTVLAYASDAYMAGAAQRPMDIEVPFAPTPGNKRLQMLVSLDHSIWYYDDAFDLADWILHIQSTVVGGDGRAIIHGRMFDRHGKLLAATIQEGLVREKRSRLKQDSKL